MSKKTLRVFQKGRVERARLKAVLGDDRLDWVYGERMEDVHLEWLADLLDGEEETLDQFSAGRAFGRTMEVDWWQEKDGYRLRTLLEQGNPPKGIEWDTIDAPLLESMGQDEHSLVLWGTFDEDLDAWAEDRVPRSLLYPVPREGGAPDQVALLVRDYRRDGVVVLTRFIAVESL
jgi:hypothetical protein